MVSELIDNVTNHFMAINRLLCLTRRNSIVFYYAITLVRKAEVCTAAKIVRVWSWGSFFGENTALSHCAKYASVEAWKLLAGGVRAKIVVWSTYAVIVFRLPCWENPARLSPLIVYWRFCIDLNCVEGTISVAFGIIRWQKYIQNGCTVGASHELVQVSFMRV